MRHATLRAGVLELWPGAPIAAESEDDRWLRFDRHPFGVVYLQRYAWDADGAFDFIVVACDRDGRIQQDRHSSLADAVATLRLAVTAPAARR